MDYEEKKKTFVRLVTLYIYYAREFARNRAITETVLILQPSFPCREL